jgi:hypothetical protein
MNVETKNLVTLSEACVEAGREALRRGHIPTDPAIERELRALDVLDRERVEWFCRGAGYERRTTRPVAPSPLTEELAAEERRPLWVDALAVALTSGVLLVIVPAFFDWVGRFAK